jgi:hypothetical protein
MMSGLKRILLAWRQFPQLLIFPILQFGLKRIKTSCRKDRRPYRPQGAKNHASW